MRPAVPDPLQGRSRKSSGADPHVPPLSAPRNGTPTTFFLSREDDMDGSQTGSTSDSIRDSTYGVQSLEETINESIERSRSEFPSGILSSYPDKGGLEDKDKDEDKVACSRRRSTIKQPESFGEGPEPNKSIFPSHSDPRRSPNPPPLSLPLTPLVLGSPGEPSSFPSSPKSTSTRSLKHLDELSIPDDSNSHAVASEDEEEPDSQSAQIHDSEPQLVMPSIKMPSRRPFTSRGRELGRFKILVAGASGSGKSSLLKSIVQLSDDIVHVDPLPQSSLRNESHAAKRKGSGSSAKHSRTGESIAEIYASTKPFPSWWCDLEDSRVLRRRRSAGDVVLERNLCFVDIIGGQTTQLDQTEMVLQYMTQQLVRALTAAKTLSPDLQGLLGGNGGSQVDAILYLIAEDTLSDDIKSIRKLSELSNVIPVIAKSDLLSQAELVSLKKIFLRKAQEAGIKPFLFGDPPAASLDEMILQPPFAISSANSSDNDNMDASLLMSPDYVQPLIHSELGSLLEKMFDRDNLTWMRHSAARKLIQNSAIDEAPTFQTPYQPRHSISSSIGSPRLMSSLSSVSPSQVLVPYPGGDPPSYTLARLADHTQREERLAQVRLAKWASDLQKSLQNERERYENLARNERAVWLTERLGECVIDGTLVPVSRISEFHDIHMTSEKAKGVLGARNGAGYYRVTNVSPNDPLGLIRWNEDVKRRSWVVVQYIGGFGIIGGVALWLAKSWGLTPQSLSELNLGQLSGSD